MLGQQMWIRGMAYLFTNVTIQYSTNNAPRVITQSPLSKHKLTVMGLSTHNYWWSMHATKGPLLAVLVSAVSRHYLQELRSIFQMNFMLHCFRNWLDVYRLQNLSATILHQCKVDPMKRLLTNMLQFMYIIPQQDGLLSRSFIDFLLTLPFLMDHIPI